MTNVSPVVLVGSHRSGTSWFGKILESYGFKGCFEPFNMFRVAELHRYQIAPHYSHIILSPEQEDKYLEDFAKPVFKGEYHTSWTKSRNKGSLSSSSRLLIKDIYLHTFFAWAMKRFSFTPLILVRHPGGVVKSMEEIAGHFKPDPWRALKDPMAFQYVGMQLTSEQIAFIEKYCAKEHGYFGKAVCRWMMDNRILLNEVKSINDERSINGSDKPPIPIVRYESMCDDAVSVVRDAFEMINLPFTGDVRKFISKSTSRDTPSSFAVTRDPAKHRDAWRANISAAEMAIINEGLSLFNLESVVTDG